MKRGKINEKKAWCPVSVYLLILSIPVLNKMSSLFANAAGLSIQATPMYCDDIKITYTLKFPNGGVWNINGNTPIGMMGTSGEGISDNICTIGFTNGLANGLTNSA